MSRRSKYETAFGTSVSGALAEARMSQTDLADKLGKSSAYTNQTMTGRKRVSPQWADLIADTLQLSPERRRDLHVAAAKDFGFKIDLTLPKG